MNESTKPNSLSTILQLLFGLAVGIVIGSAIIYFYVKPKMDSVSSDTTLVMKGGKQAAEAWLNDVQSGKLAQAHEATTPEFRGRVDLKSFEELVAKHPGLKTTPIIRQWMSQGGGGNFSVGLDGVQAKTTPSVFTLKGELRPKDGAAEDFEVVILKDKNSDRLLVDQFRIEPAPAPKP